MFTYRPLCREDDKRNILLNGIDTLALGHYMIGGIVGDVGVELDEDTDEETDEELICECIYGDIVLTTRGKFL